MSKFNILKYKKTILTGILVTFGIFETFSQFDKIEATQNNNEIICEITPSEDSANLNITTKKYCDYYGLNHEIVYPVVNSLLNRINSNNVTKKKLDYLRQQHNDDAIINSLIYNIYVNPKAYGFVDLDNLYIAKEVVEEEVIDTAIDGHISPGTSDTAFEAQAYELTEEETLMLYAIVYAEASEHKDYVESDAMGVASVILNRMENGYWGEELKKVISAKGQFGGYKNSKYQRAMKNPDVVPDEMKDAVDRVVKGQRNTECIYFLGKGKYNKFH